MRKYDTVYGLFTAICDSIRSKKGTSEMISHQDIPDEILSIESGNSGMEVTNKYIRMIPRERDNLLEDFTEDIEKYVIDGTETFYGKAGAAGDYYSNLNGKTIKFHSLFNFLYGNTYFNNPVYPIDVSHWDVSEVWNMKGCFCRNNAMETIAVENWDTKNVLDFSSMFEYCTALKSLDLSHWDVSEATSMAKMFYTCAALENLNLKNWDTKNVEDMDSLFYNCNKLIEIDVGHFNLDKCNNITNLFYGCSSLKKVRIPSFRKVNPNSIFYSCMNLYDLQFSNNGTFSESIGGSATFNLATIWKYTQDTVVSETGLTYGHYYEAFANSIGTNTTGKTRTIKLNTNLYNSLSDTQKSLLIDKGYTLTYGT